MQAPVIALIVAAETYLILLALIGVLLWLTRHQHNWIAHLENHPSVLPCRTGPIAYSTLLTEALNNCYSSPLSNGVKVREVETTSQSLSSLTKTDTVRCIRSMFLKTEINGITANLTTDKIFWQEFAASLTHILKLIYRAPQETLNLPHQQLSHNKPDVTLNLIQKISKHLTETAHLDQFFDPTSKPKVINTTNIPLVEEPTLPHELFKLRTLTDEQYKVIPQREKKVIEVYLEKGKSILYQEPVAQGWQRSNFLRESDTFDKLLENELDSARTQAKVIKIKLNNMIQENLKEAISRFSQDHRITYNDTINSQDAELHNTQIALATLQKQYTDLESRYFAPRV